VGIERVATVALELGDLAVQQRDLGHRSGDDTGEHPGSDRVAALGAARRRARSSAGVLPPR